MNTERPCGCKGIRTCIQCEQIYKIEKISLINEVKKLEAWSYCPSCEKLFEGWNVWMVCAEHPGHGGAEGISFPGVLVKENFIDETEGGALVQELDRLPWAVSQSGRRKQNFGPKTNFKKRKLQNGSFQGFPEFSKFIQERFKQVDLMRNFQAIEQCSLEYEPSKGASIDPHIDDCWIWGERVVTLNCLGDSVLTLTLYNGRIVPANSKYNLNLVSEYTDKLLLPLIDEVDLQEYANRVIRIPMPNLSLIVLYGPPRYQFEHFVLREDVLQRRICIAYREFTPQYISGNEKGDVVTKNARTFWKTPLQVIIK